MDTVPQWAKRFPNKNHGIGYSLRTACISTLLFLNCKDFLDILFTLLSFFVLRFWKASPEAFFNRTTSQTTFSSSAA